MPKHPLCKYRTRQGRPQKWLTFSYDKTADQVFQIAGKIVEETKKNWDTLNLVTKMDLLSKLLPLALKRIPDKTEIKQLSMTIDQSSVERILLLAERNLSIREELKSSAAESLKKNNDSENQNEN